MLRPEVIVLCISLKVKDMQQSYQKSTVCHAFELLRYSPCFSPMAIEKIILGGGCFWCTEAVFDQLKGVHSVMSGYSGGHVEHPTYRQVCGKQTGHTEAIFVEFDNEQISLSQLLEIFWVSHDPTTPNRQGNDVGPQYRSAIYYFSEEQKEIIDASIKDVAASIWQAPIVTEVAPYLNFYNAEQEHQDFYARHSTFHGYCRVVISPKVSKVRQKYAHLLKS